ncbi:hypothetical protein [Mucilaginibacter conchicola]|nr:hypothetical protein [Mucilaginibacter conchicola]
MEDEEDIKEHKIIYPDHLIEGINESLAQADEGKLTLFTSVKDMLAK